MRPTILLVEDNADEAALTRQALSETLQDPEVTVAADGVEALAVLRREGVAPRLVLLDLNMPRMSGAETLRRLRADARTRRLPVVVLTSSAEDRDLRESYDLGANGYVRKPLDFEELVDVASALSRYWLEINEAPPVG